MVGKHPPVQEGDMAASSDTQLQGLIDLAKRGDQEAKTLLLDHSCDRLLKLTRKMFRAYPTLRRWEQTDDVFQNSLIRLHRYLSTVEVQSVRHFLNLAAVQIRRELLDLKKHHFGVHGRGTLHHTDHQPADSDGGVLAAKSSEEPEDLSMWSDFHQTVDELPEEVREVFDLLFYEGLAQEDAAALLEISPRTLKRRWHEAKTLLHEKLNGG